MTNGRGLNLMKQWVKVAFAILLGVAFVVVFESWFLAIMTWTFLFFIPSQDEEAESSFSSAIFTWGMALLIYLAFNQSEILGLGLSIDLTKTWFSLGEGGGQIAVIALLVALFVRGITNIAPTRGGQEAMGIKWFIDISVYLLIVFLALFLQIWEWETATIIFLAIWAMAYISGAGGDQNSRQTIGVIMIIVSFVIFSLGVGTQLVGGAFFGQWFPSVYQGISAVTAPLADILAGISEGFKNVIQLITCPTCYAQSIINGSYQKDPETGLTGAFGVEIMELKTTPILVGQPFQSIVKIKNRGAFEASKIKVKMIAGDKLVTDTKAKSLSNIRDDIKIDGFSVSVRDLEVASLREFGYVSIVNKMFCDSPTMCYRWVDGDESNKLDKIDIRQMFFQSTEGISCSAVVKYNLREKFIPLKAAVEYKYHTDSTIDIEFISKGEWDRLVKAGTISTQMKKPAQLKNAPVRLNLDTPDQPIREGGENFIGISMISAKMNGKVSNGSMSVEIPTKLLGDVKSLDDVKKIQCFPNTAKPDITPKTINQNTDTVTFTWTNDMLKDSYLVYCTLTPLDFKTAGITGPSQTFVIKASADYSFEETKDFPPLKLEFGGMRCCEEASQCPAGMACLPNNQCGSDAELDVLLALKGQSNFCEEKAKYIKKNYPGWASANIRNNDDIQPECSLHTGGCKTGECSQVGVPGSGKAECRTDVIKNIGICCAEGESDPDCKKAYEVWLPLKKI